MNIKEVTYVSKTLKLLYVEDNALARISTLEMLENFFIDIVVAIDGQDGLEKFQQNDFDIVLSDINMPKLNGIEMLEGIRELDKEIPVLFLSAHNEVSYLLDGIKLGVDGYIIKPFELKPFITTLKKITEKIVLRRENENYRVHLESEVLERTKELNEKLHYDELTHLYNRYSFFEDMATISSPIIFIIDINKFKVINEIYGVQAGSLVLKEFAKFLLACRKGTNYKVYRLSGDEFILLDSLEDVSSQKYKKEMEYFFRLLKRFKVDLGDDTIFLEATIGISISKTDTFENAKTALDFAKSHKKQYEIYSSAIDKRDEEKTTLLYKNITKSAIEDNRIVPVYQAIVDKEGTIIKHETLMRLQEEGKDELLSPFYFLNIAMKTGLYHSLSSFIIFNALKLLCDSSHTLTINFAYADIENSALLDEIDDFFKENPHIGQRVVFEITESQSMENYDDVKDFIKRFRKYGVKIAVDDFGSGFSNFEYILEIEPDYLKIDGSLIKDIDKSEKAFVLVKAIVQFSHELGIKVIAEYVHSQTVFSMLKELDVDEYQGFYFYKPNKEIVMDS